MDERDMHGRTVADLLAAYDEAGIPWDDAAPDGWYACADPSCPEWTLGEGPERLWWKHYHLGEDHGPTPLPQLSQPR